MGKRFKYMRAVPLPYEQQGAVHTGTEKFDFFPFTCGYMKIPL